MLLAVDFWPRESCWCAEGGGDGAAGSGVACVALGGVTESSLGVGAVAGRVPAVTGRWGRGFWANRNDSWVFFFLT